ncbi:hypothetical protein ['Camptotheca acuminata' phytoplasma]
MKIKVLIFSKKKLNFFLGFSTFVLILFFVKSPLVLAENSNNDDAERQ